MANPAEVRNPRIRLRRAIPALMGLVVFGIALVVTPSATAQVVGAGTFNLTGAIDVTGTAFTFGNMVAPPPGDQMARAELPLTGQFSDIVAGVNVPIKNLSAPTVIPGTPFLVSDWITLPDGIDLDLMNIPISSASHTCTSADDAPGSICRAIANSPITLEQGTDYVHHHWALYYRLSGKLRHVSTDTDAAADDPVHHRRREGALLRGSTERRAGQLAGSEASARDTQNEQRERRRCNGQPQFLHR